MLDIRKCERSKYNTLCAKFGGDYSTLCQSWRFYCIHQQVEREEKGLCVCLRSLLMDPASPGELRSRHPPLLLWLSCPAWRCQGDLLEKRGREGGREGKVLTETSLVVNQPRFASLLWKGALPAASPCPQQEQLPGKTPRPKTCYPKHRMSPVISCRVEKHPTCPQNGRS